MHGDEVLGAREKWLENNINREPVDGQHIVQTCREAKIEHEAGLLPHEEYGKVFFVRRAKFLVYNDSCLYIDALMRINANEFERHFYTTMVEDLMKLRVIWIAYGRLDHYVRDNDERWASIDNGCECVAFDYEDEEQEGVHGNVVKAVG